MLFLKYLLEYIRGWAELFPTYSCINGLTGSLSGLDSEQEHHGVDTESETEFLQIYNTLIKEQVAFPSKELFTKKKSE